MSQKSGCLVFGQCFETKEVKLMCLVSWKSRANKSLPLTSEAATKKAFRDLSTEIDLVIEQNSCVLVIS